MTKVTTRSGFEIEIDESCMDDMELLDMISELADGGLLTYPKIAGKIMSADEKKRLYDHIRDQETGRVPTEAFAAELTDIFDGLKSGKKSSLSPV